MSIYSLGAFLRAWDDGTPCEYGQTDCLQFVGAWIEKVAGHNPAAQYKGEYSSAMGAGLILYKRYKLTGEAAMTAALSEFGDVADTPKTGDLVLVKGVSTDTDIPPAGILNGRLMTTVGETGLVSVSYNGAPAWRIKRVTS